MSDMEEIDIQAQIQTDPRLIDPNAVPQQLRADRYASFKHPEGVRGVMRYDRFTLQVQEPKGYSGNPIRLPNAFKGIPQRNVGTCSQPGSDNLGCPCWTGCPYHGHGPFMAIMAHSEIDGLKSPAHCYHIWTGYMPDGSYVTQVPMIHNGWRVDTSSRTVPYITTKIERKDGGYRRMRYAGEYEVKELGPMYHATPPANVKEEVCIGEVSLNEALKRWNKPSEQEVVKSGALHADVDGNAAPSGSEDRPVRGRKRLRAEPVHDGKGNRKRRGRPPRRNEGVEPGDASASVQPRPKRGRPRRAGPGREVGADQSQPGSGTPSAGVLPEVDEAEFFGAGLGEDAAAERSEADRALDRDFKNNIDRLQGRDE